MYDTTATQATTTVLNPVSSRAPRVRRWVAAILLTVAAAGGFTVPGVARADWDAVQEAKDEARRKAARDAAARQAAEQKARTAAIQADANRQLADRYRKTYGDRTKGMTDEQVLTAGRKWDAEKSAQAMQQAADALKSLSPEQRAMMEQMMRQAAAAQKQ